MSPDRHIARPALPIALAALWISGCSMFGLSNLDVASCATDQDCSSFNDLAGDSCEVYLCNATTRTCEPGVRDDDDDGESPLRCGGDDCDDSDSAIGPGGEEVCGNLVDEDCSGAANDLDCDGSDSVENGGDDCDDENSRISPRLSEVCGNLVDEDCSGVANDLDCDGSDSIEQGGDDCDDQSASVSPHQREVCNGIDDDCDGELDRAEEDNDGDGFADSCAGALARDCDDENPLTYLEAPELCDGLDNDCSIDGVPRLVGGPLAEPREDRDGDGHVSPDTACEHREEEPTSLPKDDCDDWNPGVYPGAPELCDGLDNDCDGVPDNDPLAADDAGSVCLMESVATGPTHSCALRRDGVVICWGDNAFGELGTNDSAPFDALAIDGLSGVTQVVTGNGFSCALEDDGEGSRVTCWGREQLVRGGTSPSPAFGPIEGLEGATQISAGATHGCAVMTEGEVRCWGLSDDSQLDGGSPGAAGEGMAPRPVPGIDDALAVSAGATVSCAIRGEARSVTCWGRNEQGQLGDASVSSSHGIGQVAGVEGVEELSCGGWACCARRAEGSVSCWGTNAGAILGTETSGHGPVEIPLPSPAVELDVAGVDFDCSAFGECSCAYRGWACARLESGETRCWGSAFYPQAEGFDTMSFVSYTCSGGGDPWGPSIWLFFCIGTPIAFDSLEEIDELSLSSGNGCALRGGELFCWGNNDLYQLGRGSASGDTEYITSPASVMAGALQTAGSCFRLPDLSLRCASEGAIAPPAELGDLQVADMSHGGRHSCLTTPEGQVLCQGDDEQGQLGSGGIEGGSVVGLPDASQVACGDAHCCALRRSGSLVCWGSNSSGQLGADDDVDGTCSRCSSLPLPLGGLGPVRSVAAGRSHTCAATEAGEVYCWGENDSGQAGAPTRRDVLSPYHVDTLPDDDPALAVAASAGGDTSCAILASGNTRCWGASLDPEGAGGSDPWSVAGMETAAQLAMTQESLCARLWSGAMRCSGLEGFDVDAILDARDVGCDIGHCCLTRTSGQSLCWGEVPAGLLGAAAQSTATPLPVVDLLGP